MLSLESQHVFQHLLLFLSFIEMVGLIHLFCYITKRISMFPLSLSVETLRFSGNKNSVLPSGLVIE